MKITKNQLRRIIKEEKAKLIAEAKVRRLVRRKLREGGDYPPSTPHPYDIAASRSYERSESNTDVADSIYIGVSDLLGDDHPLAQRISYLIDRSEDDYEDLLDEIDVSVLEDQSPADIKDKLMAHGMFD